MRFMMIVKEDLYLFESFRKFNSIFNKIKLYFRFNILQIFVYSMIVKLMRSIMMTSCLEACHRIRNTSYSSDIELVNLSYKPNIDL